MWAALAAMILVAGAGVARSQDELSSHDTSSSTNKLAPKVVLQTSPTMAHAQGATQNQDHAYDGNVAPSQLPANAGSVSAVNGAVKETKAQGQQLLANDSNDDMAAPNSVHTEVGVPAPKPKSSDKRASRNGIVTGAYAGYVAMSVFGLGFLGLLFAVGGGYLFGNHIWKMEHPSS